MPSTYLHFCVIIVLCVVVFNPLNAELNPICYLLVLLGVHHILHVSRLRVKGRPMCRHYQFAGFAKYVGKTYMIAYKPKLMRSTTNQTTNPGCQVADS